MKIAASELEALVFDRCQWTFSREKRYFFRKSEMSFRGFRN